MLIARARLSLHVRTRQAQSTKVKGTACLALNTKTTVQAKLHEAQTAERKRLENAKRECNAKRRALNTKSHSSKQKLEEAGPNLVQAEHVLTALLRTSTAT